MTKLSGDIKVIDIPGNQGKSRWGDEIKALPPGKALLIPLNGRDVNSVRTTIWCSCARAGIHIKTKTVGDALAVWARHNGDE